jgi:hypothetical protein
VQCLQFDGVLTLAGVVTSFVFTREGSFEGLANGGVCATQGLAWRCPIGTGLYSTGDGSTMPGMVAQGWGWMHRVGGDREDVLCSPHITTLSWASIGSVGVHSTRASSSLFEGCNTEEGRERVAQCQKMSPTTPHNTRIMPVMAAQQRAVRTAPVPDSQAASGDQRGGDSLFDPGARGVSGNLMLRSGEQVRCCGPRGSLKRGRDLIKGCHALERGGSLPRGIPPRARWRFARGRLWMAI